MAANCVTNLQKKLADYIAALDKFNIPDSNLEMLLHKWLNLPENAELFRLGKLPFPSDEWLQEHLYAPASIVSEPRILEMYDKHLSEPIITDTIENANNIVRTVSKIISKDSIKILPTKDGKYLVVVTRPKFDNSVEINKILANAPRDEQGRLLAPNGKPSNLTEQQYAQVRTKEFINWFGDWINDPKNASKIVDENGEPLVVWHASNASFNTFKERDGIHFGTYATAIGLAEEKGIIRDATIPGEIDRLLQSNKLFLYSSFLNIRNITISEDIGTGWHTIIDKGFDGAQYDAVEGGESYVVFNPNQIKSATDNIGTFSRESNNIYYNIVRNKNNKENLLVTLRQEGLIHRHDTGDKYVLTLNADTKQGSQNDIDSVTRRLLIQQATDKVHQRLESLGFPKNVVIIKDTKSGGTAYVDVNENVLEQVKDAVSLGATIEDVKAIYDLADFLGEKFGVKFGGIISLKLANQMTNNANPNAFILNNTVYVVANRVTVDTVAEEFLHPFVNTLYLQSPKVFKQLHDEAVALFPNLKTQIYSNYRGRKNHKFTATDLMQELVAQALSRHFREEYEQSLLNGPLTVQETLKKMDESENFFTKAWNAIKKLFKELQDKLIGERYVFEGDNLKNLSLRQVAKLINASDSSFWTIHDTKIRFNISDERISISESNKNIITERPLLLDDYNRPIIESSELSSFLNDIEFFNSTKFNSTAPDTTISIPYSDWKKALTISEASAGNVINEFIDIYGSADGLFEYNKETKLYKIPYHYAVAIRLLNKYPKLSTLLVKEFDKLNNREFGNLISAIGANPNIFSLIESLLKNVGVKYLYIDKNQLEIDFNGLTQYTESQNGITNVTNSELPLPVTEKPKASDNLITEGREKTENEIFFEQQSELARLLNTIYGVDAVFTGAEYSQIVHDIIYKISDIITEVERNPEAALRYNTNIQDTSVLKNADRKNIFALLGFDNILNFISSEYFHPANNTAIDGRKAIKQAKIIRDNIKAFVKSGMSLFAQLELFSLPSVDNLELVDTESDTTDPNVNEADNSVEFLQEMVGDSQEAWQRESRTEVAYDRASILVKQALTQCYKLNPDGTPITDKWGVKQRMDGREALQAIIKWTQGALTLSSMVKKLEARATKEKWLQPIIDRLKDTSGKETAFLSQFFGVVSKYFQLYSIGKNTGRAGKRNYTVFEVNTHPALTEAKRGISGQYNAGVHLLFDSNGNVNSTFFELLKTISETLHKMLYSEDNTLQIAELLSDASMLLGYPVSVEGIQEILNADTFKQMTANSLLFIVKGIENNKNKDTWQPFSAKREDDGIINNIGKFIEPITSRLEDVANTSFYDSGNMYQSYVIPSYLTKLILKVSLSTEEEYTEFIEKEYGKFAQFKDSKGQWRNSWLQLLQDLPDARHLFTHKVQLNFDGNKYMVSRGGARSMSDADLTLSIIAEYFKEEGANSTKRLAPAWFRVPLMSNKPSSEFIKFYSYRGPDYKNRVLNGCLHLFRQELSRMQTVKKRLEIFEKGSPELIQSFDSERGLKFCFFDFLNNVDNSRFKELVEKYTTNTITELEKGELSDLGKTLIQKGIEEEWQKQLTEWQNNGVVEAAGNIQNISKDNVEKALENFFWNDFLASNNILNLTVTDLAYYKNTEDVQKRLAQLHAPGIRANIEATDFEGKKVSDGYTRTIYLKDLEIDGKTLKSNIIENVKVVFNRKLETLKGTPLYDAAKAAYKSIIESFEKGINVTDAQGYASPSSYRKKALLFGKWTTQAEEIYQKIISGEYTYTDIQTIFQPLKPFVYTQIEKDSDVDNVELPTIKMGVQNKNSEYLLIMAAAITQNEDTGMPNYLRAIYKVMEESHKDSVKGIDTVQFESTVKTGLTGVIDISEAATTEEAEELLRDAIYSNRDTREYDKTFVLELPFEDYCIQQEVPAHFRDHEQLQGSQIRMITVSDLNPNETYMVEGREVSAEEFRNEYEQTVAANILESINDLIEEFNLTPDATVKDRNIALAKVLQKEILSSPRYGIDLLISCLLDENGKFMLPLGDPIQSKRIEQLINSIVKNRINKLKIAGGPIVQVSNFGTSRQLNIRFKGKNGETLKTLNDYISEGRTEQEWVEYIKENLAGIAYYEAYVPVYASEVFEDFMDALGNIDIEAIEAVNPDLLKMIGYRIPSEDKYSMAPIKVVGFMPKEAGDGIMLPYEITLITGSDYDIDKFYLMRKDIPLHKKDNKEIRKALIDKFGKDKKDDINIFLDMLSNSTQKPVAKANYPDLWKEYVKIAYKAEPPTEGRLYRNNKIIDMTWEVLTHSDTADKILNPGGFEEQKLVGYLVQAARITGKSIKELEKLSTSLLKKICQTDKNIAFIGTHLQFYKQNAAASSILAIFAVAKVTHACLESNGFSVNMNEVCGLVGRYSIMGLNLYRGVQTNENELINYVGDLSGADSELYIELDPQKDIEGTFIGKTLGSLVASAADAVKDPVLNLMNINSDTVNMLNTLIRIGLPFRKAAKLLSTKVVSDLLTKYNTEKLKGFTTFNTILNDSIKEIVNNLNINISDVNLEDLTEDEVNAAILKNDNKVDYKILLALKRVSLINEAMSGLNFATRFNSISSAVGPLIIDNLKIEHTLAKYFGEFPGIFVHGHDAGFTDVFNLHPILEKFADSVDVARKLFGNHMPTYSYLFGHILECLKGYTLLDTLFRDRKLFSQFNDFYQSYLLVANNVVSGDASVLKYYIEDFPKEFAKYKTTYAGNPFIDAIRFDVDSESGNPVLKINTTGLDAEAKSKLTSGWLDLYKSGDEGKKLAFDLFQYCFYKGGIGFNPQTFMTLLPIQVKMQLKGYKETFEQLPAISASHLLDCFIRNNLHNDKVIPYRKFEKPLPLHDGGFTDFYEEDALKLQNILAFKTEINGKEFFFIQTYFSLENMTAIYRMATPLGNGGEFVEIPNIPTIDGKEQPITITKREYNSLIEELEYEEVPVDTSTMTEQQVREMVDDIFGKTSTANDITQKKQLIVKKLNEKGVEVDEAKVENTAKQTC